MKQLLILGDFHWLEGVTREGARERDQRRMELDTIAMVLLRDEISRDLARIEEVLGASSARGLELTLPGGEGGTLQHNPEPP